jgi:ABC-type Mn2+/Zn2+ transport system permease subunit
VPVLRALRVLQGAAVRLVRPRDARTLGYNVRWWDLLLYLTLGVVIASAMQFAGVMLVFNFLVLPA